MVGRKVWGMETNTKKSLSEIRGIIKANLMAGRDQYFGLTSAEIGRRNQSLMWGDNNEACPSTEEWTMIVD